MYSLAAILIATATAIASPFDDEVRLVIKTVAPDSLQVGDQVAGALLVQRKLQLPRWFVITSPPPIGDSLALLRQDSRIEYVEVDSEIHPMSLQEEPLFTQQWALENLPSKGGHWDIDMDVLESWSQGATGQGVLIAVLDTGVMIDHPELVTQIWENLDEIPANGIDDDLNGFIDDHRGGNSVWLDGNVYDQDGHGTACAGLIAAVENGSLISGIAKDATILPVRIFGKGDEGSFTSHAADGIIYAVDQGAQVLSNSWTSGTGKKKLITEAIQYAHDHNALFIASAGNSPIDADIEGFFPATSDESNVISVAASDRFGHLVDHPGIWGSTYGSESVDVSAPGDGVLAPTLENDVLLFGGTSAAAPLVSGLAGILWSIDPLLDNLTVKNLILDSVDSANHKTQSGGRANAGNAVRLLNDGLLPFQPYLEVKGDFLVDSPLQMEALNAESCEWYLPDSKTRHQGRQITTELSQPGEWVIAAVCQNELGQVGRGQLEVSIPIPWSPASIQPIESEHEQVTGGSTEVNFPPGTEWARFHFDRLELNTPQNPAEYAYVTIYDSEDLWVWSSIGQHEDLWTPPLKGREFTVYWGIEDSTQPSWGFRLDKAETWSSNIPFPLDLQVEFPFSRVDTQRGRCNTGTVNLPYLAWLWVLPLTLVRRRSKLQEGAN